MDKIMQIYKEILLSDLSREVKSLRIQALIKIILIELFNIKRIPDQRINNPPLLNSLDLMTRKLSESEENQERETRRFEKGFEHYFFRRSLEMDLELIKTGQELHYIIRGEWERKSWAEKQEYLRKNNI